MLKQELESRTVDDEDMDQIIAETGSLKMLSFHRNPSVDPEVLFPSFRKLLYLDIQDSKIGLSPALIELIANSQYLCVLNIRNILLGDDHTMAVVDAIEQSHSINNLNMAFNNIGVRGVTRVIDCVLTHPNLVIVDLSRNLFG